MSSCWEALNDRVTIKPETYDIKSQALLVDHTIYFSDSFISSHWGKNDDAALVLSYD